MIFYKGHEYNKKAIFSRCIEILPSLSIHLYQNYKFESIRFSWLGFTIGIGKE